MQKIWLLLCLIIGSLWLSTSPVSAAADWQINRFHSAISVQPDGKVKVVERLDVDFGLASKHGIYRDIPYEYTKDGQTTYTSIDVWGVMRDGHKEPYDTSQKSGYLRIKIGDEDKTIDQTHSYEITYFVSGVLRSFEHYDELYWNVTGNQWDVRIEQASAIVTLPRKQIIQTSCYEGKSGSDECMTAKVGPLEARFSGTRPLQPGEEMTVAVGFTKDIVPILTVAKPQTFGDKVAGAWQRPVTWLALAGAVLLGLFLPVLLWWKRGRDYWWQNPGILDGSQPVSLKPWKAKRSVVVEFEPPEGLRPGQLGLLLDERADTLDVTSTIVDLASRGYLTIAEKPKKWLFGSTDYELHRTDKPDNDLLGYESMLLQRLFEGQPIELLSSLKYDFYDDLKKVKQKLYDSLTDKKYFVGDPEKVRQKYLVIGALVIAGGMATLVGANVWQLVWLGIAGLTPLIGGAVLMIVAWGMPQRTALGHDVYHRALGYKQFINTAEKYRQQFFEKENLFNEVLPYAMVLGMTEKFAKAMEQIGYQPSQPSWYTGAHAFNMVAFSHSMSSMSQSMNSAMAATPSGSGSGGGGFSGGGFGGGGGGSW
jgi:hypothetical protein